MAFIFGRSKSKPEPDKVKDETKAKAIAEQTTEQAAKKEVIERRKLFARTKARVTGGQRQLLTQRGSRASALGNPDTMPLRASLGPRSGPR
tara:strand:- start:403 stop:675 length:273 start_codon:yes stop_codon:yes gene_type:complete